jgi:septal ring factor EnvC (AmiA/AmiB activator)
VRALALALVLAWAAPVVIATALLPSDARAQSQSTKAPQTAAQKRAAAQKAAAQRTLERTRKQIEALASEQKRIEAERDSAAKALREADGQVAGTERSLRALEADIAHKRRALEQLQERRVALEASLSRQRAELAALVRSAYALGKHQDLKLLLEQGRIGDLARVLAYHRYFERSRRERATRLDAQLQELAEVQGRIEGQRQALVEARDARRRELDALAAQRRERGALVASLDARYKDRSARLKSLGRDEKNTAALLERLRKLMAQLPKPRPKPVPPRTARSAKGGAAGAVRNAAIPTGPMALPLVGNVLAGYGGTMPDGHKSQGLLIAGNTGAQVTAVRAGRVAYADWLKGYGLLLILDHGNGWMSLYAFNDALLKSVGDEVRAGEAIGTVGSSGGQGRPALYFELRRNGQPQDPATWLRR